MKILITNPTGKIGSRVVRDLLAPEFTVRVLVREPARLCAEVRGQVEVIQGSGDDPAALTRALKDVEALFWSVPGESRQETDIAGHYDRFGRAVAQAVRAAKTPRVVNLSMAGPVAASHALEDRLNESGAAVRHLRCGLLMENILAQWQSLRERGVFSFPLAGAVPVPLVAAEDVADMALRWLVWRNWGGTARVAVYGRQDLTCHAAAAILAEVLERPVRYQEVAANQYVETLLQGGASLAYARSRVEMFGALGRGVAAEPRTNESTTTTSLAAWAQAGLRPRFQNTGTTCLCHD